MPYENFPATDMHNLNLDWLLRKVKELERRVTDPVAEDATRRIVLIGDSYGTLNGGGDVLAAAFPEQVINFLRWDADRVLYRFTNGFGFCNGGFEQELDDLVVSEDAADEVTDVYVFGGWNDEIGREGVSNQAIIDHANAFRTAALIKFPNARCHISFISWGYRAANTMQNLRQTQETYMGLRSSGWITHPNMAYVMHTGENFFSGSVHPNQTGVNRLAMAAADVIQTGDCHVAYSVLNTMDNITLPSGDGWSGGAAVRLSERLVDGVAVLDFYCTNASIQFGATKQIYCSGDREVTLFTVSGNSIIKGYYDNVSMPVTLQFTAGSDNYQVPGTLIFDNGEVRFLPSLLVSGTWPTYQTISADRVQLSPTHWAGPAI